LLDSAFGCRERDSTFGLDPIWDSFQDWRSDDTPVRPHCCAARCPNAHSRIVQVRMVINALIDLLIGFISVAGDLFDSDEGNVWKLALLERYAHPQSKPSRGTGSSSFLSSAFWCHHGDSPSLLPRGCCLTSGCSSASEQKSSRELEAGSWTLSLQPHA